MSDTYADVDASDDPEGAVAWQHRVDSWPAIRAYKSRIAELVAGRRPLLDVGAGPGGDARRLGAVAVDASVTMARAARGDGVPVMVGDAHALPCRSGEWSGAIADRVFSHLLDPDAALAEMVRLLRPGGRLVVADPDQQSLVIRVPGVPDATIATLRRLRRDVGYRNGCLVTTLPARLGELGLTDVAIDAYPLVLHDPDDAFGIPTWVDHWRATGGFTDDDDRRWRERLVAGRGAGFVYAVTYFVVSGLRR